MSFHNLVNTHYLSEAANDFRRNGGAYTLAPKGSSEYLEYWKLHEKRCREGYRVGDIWITGRHYFFLNFFVMEKTKDEDDKEKYLLQTQGKDISRIGKKELDFPRFTEMQYEWWRLKHIAWNGGSFMGINSPGGKHMVLTKCRGSGFSFSEAADAVYNFNFLPRSHSIFAAANEGYLTMGGVLNKVEVGLNWINDHSPYWKQNRQKKGVLMHQKASFIDEFGDEKGSMAEIQGVILNNANKIRGKRALKVTFEEAGSFPDLLQALEIAKGNVQAGSVYTGQITVGGTGGEEGPSLEGLQSIWENPNAHDFLALPDIFGGTDEQVGYFCPVYRTDLTSMDDNGNVDYKLAIATDDRYRAMAKTDKNPKAFDKRIAEYPRTPSESFNRISGNEFEVAKIDKQIKRIETQKAIKAMMRNGRLEHSSSQYAIGGIEFIPEPYSNPIDNYPHNQSDDLTGCVTILEKPYQDINFFVPAGMYTIVFDAYYKDEAVDKTSLFDITVLKQDNNIDSSYTGLPVAWYTGRPKSLATCHEILFMFADYYNCSVQGEIGGGGQGVVDYAKLKRKLHRVEFEPEMLHNKEIASKTKNRSYLMNMSTDRKRLGMTYLIDWHKEQIGIAEDGVPILRLDRIYKLGLLREMRKGGISNSDRMSSMIIGMFTLKENISKRIKHHKKADSFFSRQLYSSNQSQETTTFY
jgi:hypothetical protein